MKKFINRADDVVEEMLQGLIVLQPNTARIAGHKVLIRSDATKVRDRRVAVISGGGSGHEPAHAGYVGEGMLSAAVLGEVFTSPSSDSVFAAIKAVSGKKGAVLVVKNYTGDRLNFGLAAEMARAEGIPVEMVIVDDDVALKGGAQQTSARGLAGTVFVHKLVGAAACEGGNLAEVASVGKAAVQALATMGVSLSAGTAPAVGRPSFELGDREMELGLGIHGEPGAQRTELRSADELSENLLTEIIKYGKFGQEKRVAVMLNSLGSTTAMELAIVARRVVPFLGDRGFTVERIYSGTFLSSLDMAGISISVLGLTDQRLRWLDSGTAAPAWPNVLKQRPGKKEETIAAAAGTATSRPFEAGLRSEAGRRTRGAILAACSALIEAEPGLTELDRVTGDGDLGTNMMRAARAVESTIDTFPVEDVAATLKLLGHTLRRELGGSSGPLYGVLFLRCGSVLEGAGPITLQSLAEGVGQGCRAISELGGAKPGDRTMLDALEPFVNALRDGVNKTAHEVLEAAVAAAERGAEATSEMKPRSGRSSYLGNRVLGYPDPGAKAVSIWLRAAALAV